ncbi:MAG TPA: hypothetical protein VLC09_14705 [Polyangiaceae bacterium]|nr:hypothetical protein [Polyangiaceae bacterium]
MRSVSIVGTVAGSLVLSMVGCALSPMSEEELEAFESTEQALPAVTPGNEIQHRVGLHVVRILKEAGEAPPLSETKIAEMVATANETFDDANIQFFVDRMDDRVMPHFTRVRGANELAFADVEDELELIAPVAGKYESGKLDTMGGWLERVGGTYMPWKNGNFSSNVFVFADNGPSPAGNQANAASRSANVMWIRNDIQNGASPTWNFAHELGHHLGMMHTDSVSTDQFQLTAMLPSNGNDECDFWDQVYLKDGPMVPLPAGPGARKLTFFESKSQCQTYLASGTWEFGWANLGSGAPKCSAACIADGAACEDDACWFEANSATSQLGLRLQGRLFKAPASFSVMRGLSRQVTFEGATQFATELMGYSPVAGWGQPHFVSDSEVEFFRDRAFRERHLTQTACFGRTKAGSTNWVQYASDGLYVDIDTRYCGLGKGRDGDTTGAPIYFASLGGNASHWLTRGVSSIYSPTASGFRIYVKRSGITPDWANDNGWHVNWVGADADMAKLTDSRHLLGSTCVGRSTPGSTAWHTYSTSDTVIYTDVDTSRCKFTSTPVYNTSLGANSGHWDTYGVTSIFKATATGFRVYINDPSGITPASADAAQYHVNWRAVPANRADKGSCAGYSGTDWEDYDPDSARITVDTSECAGLFSSGAKPTIFTTVTGSTLDLDLRGTTSIYSPTPNGFSIYLQGSGLSAAVAKSRGMRIRWVMQP